MALSQNGGQVNGQDRPISCVICAEIFMGEYAVSLSDEQPEISVTYFKPNSKKTGRYFAKQCRKQI